MSHLHLLMPICIAPPPPPTLPRSGVWQDKYVTEAWAFSTMPKK